VLVKQGDMACDTTYLGHSIGLKKKKIGLI
jgi:hypothetical protein